MKNFQYNKINFNAEHISSLTADEFVSQNMASHFEGESDEMKEKQLREIHAACVALCKPQDASTFDAATTKGAKKGKNSNEDDSAGAK